MSPTEDSFFQFYRFTQGLPSYLLQPSGSLYMCFPPVSLPMGRHRSFPPRFTRWIARASVCPNGLAPFYLFLLFFVVLFRTPHLVSPSSCTLGENPFGISSCRAARDLGLEGREPVPCPQLQFFAVSDSFLLFVVFRVELDPIHLFRFSTCG